MKKQTEMVKWYVKFASANNVMIMSTQFQHKQIHKATLISLDQTTVTQTDHVLVNANKKEVIQNIRSMKGPNMDSDHFLHTLINKENLLAIYRKKALQFKKWNKANLQNPIKLLRLWNTTI
jgi:hypothetical protein